MTGEIQLIVFALGMIIGLPLAELTFGHLKTRRERKAYQKCLEVEQKYRDYQISNEFSKRKRLDEEYNTALKDILGNDIDEDGLEKYTTGIGENRE